MTGPTSCIRCSWPLADPSPSGLCASCAATAISGLNTLIRESDAVSVASTSRAAPNPRTFSAPTLTADFGAAATRAACCAAPPYPPPPPGYEIVDRLGRGGMGSVYLARDLTADRLVAMKFLHDPGDPGSYERFLVELRILAKLDHPNIVRVLASDFLRADPFFTMEHMKGGALSRAVEGGAVVRPAEAVRLAREVAGALAAAHAVGVIHRDLKPANILVAADGTPKVADFGLAKRLEQGEQLTPASGALGTASYMPPEQVTRRNGDIGPWSDVYGLGATLYHLLTGRPPFHGETTADTVIQLLSASPERPRAIRPEIPLRLEGIVVKCLEKNPRDRYQSMAEVIADLDRYEANEGTVAPQLTRPRRLRRWLSRHRRGTAVAAVAALVAVVASAGLVGAGRAPAPAPAGPAEVIPDEVRTPDGRLLPFRVRLGHDKSKVTAAADGTITISTWGLCLVEYAPPEPRPGQYQFRASVRHEKSDLAGEVGVYFAHRALPGPFGDQHMLGRVSYNDIRSPADKAKAAAQPWPVRVPPPAPENRPRVGFISVLPGHPAEWTGQDWLASGDSFRVCGNAGNCWRDLEIAAGPGGVSAAWCGRWFDPVPAEKISATFAAELTRAKELAADKAPPPPAAGRYDPAGGVGVFVEQSVASFREVRVGPAGPRN